MPESRPTLRTLSSDTQRTQISRRDSIRTSLIRSAAASTAWSLVSREAWSADASESLNRYPRMVHEYFVDQVRASGERHAKRILSLETDLAAKQYVVSARQRIRASFGPEPERTPLNARVTRVIDRDDYRIENLIYESRPGFPVTGNLYMPKGVDAPMPAVVGTCGHSSNGKAAESYQAFAQGLARLGYACLIYDPIGQGERIQYPNANLKSKIGAGVGEHLHAGNQQFLVGENLCMWRAWDGIRALDYLLTRPEIDPSRIGVTGNSGGGTMTTWLCGLDTRWAMAAPSCFVSTFRRNMENELPQDTEQCPPRALALNLDHADFLAAMAPRPIIILAKEKDYFDVRGSEETYERLRHLYRLLGAERNIALFVGPTGHGFSRENREAMYSWFYRAIGKTPKATDTTFDGVLQTQKKVPFCAEPTITLEEDKTLWCTPKGQVSERDGTRTVFDFTQQKSIALAASRKRLRGAPLQRAIRDALQLKKNDRSHSIPDHRHWRHLGSRDYPSRSAMAYAIETEPGIQSVVYRLTDERWHSRPPKSGPKATLYVSHLSSDAELREEPLIREIIEADPKTAFFTCDVRGIGESLPQTCAPGSFHSAYGNDFFYAIYSVMLDRPYVGQKTFDLLRVLTWLKGYGHTQVHLVGRGWGALVAAFAGVLSDVVSQVTLKNALTSYQSIAEAEEYEWPLSSLLPNVLKTFDLPDCYAELEKKQLRQIEPWDAQAGN